MGELVGTGEEASSISALLCLPGRPLHQLSPSGSLASCVASPCPSLHPCTQPSYLSVSRM
jgi:hypothetical protein